MGDHTAEHDGRLDRQFERLVFFSDAVFAIAITLLVLDLRAPPGPHGELRLSSSVGSIISFAISFFVIGRYWLAHHALFGALRREDGALRAINLVFLFSVVFLPFPTKVLEAFPLTTTSVMFYALSVAAVGLLQVVLCFVARRPHLLRAGETRGGTVHFAFHSLSAPLVFLASTAVAWPTPRLTPFVWILILPASLLADRLGRRIERRLDARRPAGAST
jgi:uncharacterized membrane protein